MEPAKRRHVRAALAASPVVLSYLALIALGHFMSGGGSHAMLLLGLPGVIGFAALVYYLAWSKGAEPAR
jgi:Zn-dependent protease with chaperone function